MQADWQVLTKGKAGQRPPAYARRIVETAWQAVGPARWIAPAVDPYQYVQPTQHLVVRWHTPSDEVKYATLICSILDWSLADVMAHYDQRGACETEFQADKTGLKLERRRKKQAAAQEALILLTDVAHNLLSWTTPWTGLPRPFAHFGPLRLTEDVLRLPGRLRFQDQRLVAVQLNRCHPHAPEVAHGLVHLLQHFGLS